MGDFILSNLPDDNKLDKAHVYNALDQTTQGYALDARQGKTLADAIAATQSDIAIIINGNQTTHTGGAAVGQYVIVRNSTISGITDGLYKAVQAIPANTAITSAYLAAVTGGLGNEVAAVNSKLDNIVLKDVISATITGTTSNEGLLTVTDYTYIGGYRLLFARTSLINVTVTPSHGENPNYLIFTSIINGSRIANTNVTAVVYMIKV